MPLSLDEVKLLKPGDTYDNDDDRWMCTVVINFETSECAPGFGLEGWGDEPGGLLVQTKEAGLVRYPRNCFAIA